MEMMGAISSSDYMNLSSTSMISFEEDEVDEEQKGKDQIFMKKGCVTPKSEIPNVPKKINQSLIILSKPTSKKHEFQEITVQPLLDETVE